MTHAAGLQRFFRPESIVLVGASERSVWSNLVLNNLKRSGFPGRIHLVNRKGTEVQGRPAATSCQALGERVDAAMLLVPSEVVIEAMADAAAAGAAGVVVLSAGFAEAGGEGLERQRALAEAARALGVRLIGPNCLGFLNVTGQASLWAGRLRAPRPGGRMAIVSQSGAVASQMSLFASMQGLGFTHLVSTGNEADVDVADIIDHLADEPETWAIGLFMESVRRPQAFAAAAAKAQDAGKALVVLMVGRSEATAKAAAAHTGSLVGDDRVFGAVCRDLGIVRVDSPEQLVVTADLLARVTPPLPARSGLGLVAMSGGVCSVSADQAEAVGLATPTLRPSTVETLAEVLPRYGTPQNPLDLTGAAVADAGLFVEGVRALGRDPGIGVVACAIDPPFDVKAGQFQFDAMRRLKDVADGMDAPLVLMSNIMGSVDADVRQTIEAIGVTYLGCGAHMGLAAIAAGVRAAGFRRRPVLSCQTGVAEVSSRPTSEHGALEHLAAHGAPVIPARLARTADEAARFAAGDGLVVLKIASADVAHKTDVGGVALDVRSEDAAAVFERIMANVRTARPDARLDGVLVSPMRHGGVELLVGVARDPTWGLTLTIGAGGALVELLDDTALRLLPVDAEDVSAMLDQLKARRLLDGCRGAPAVDRQALVEAIMAIAAAASALGPELEAFEVNPLLASERRAEALDALAVWSSQPDGPA